MRKVERSERMEEIAREVIEEHEDLSWIEEDRIQIAYVVCDQEKKHQDRFVLGECKKADPTMKALAGCDFVVTFYEPNVRHFTDQQLRILMYHELLHAAIKNGSLAIEPHDYVVGEFRKIVEEYGADWAAEGSMRESE